MDSFLSHCAAQLSAAHYLSIRGWGFWMEFLFGTTNQGWRMETSESILCHMKQQKSQHHQPQAWWVSIRPIWVWSQETRMSSIWNSVSREAGNLTAYTGCYHLVVIHCQRKLPGWSVRASPYVPDVDGTTHLILCRSYSVKFPFFCFLSFPCILTPTPGGLLYVPYLAGRVKQR